MLIIPERILGVSYLLKLLFLSLLEQRILCYNEAFGAGPTYLGMLELSAIKKKLLTFCYYFVLFINNLLLNIQGANLVLFADDTNLVINEKNESALQYKTKYVTKEFGPWFQRNNFIINTGKKIAMSIVMHTPCILYCLLFIPTNAQTHILKYFISTSRCFSASAPSSGRLSFVLAKVTNY